MAKLLVQTADSVPYTVLCLGAVSSTLASYIVVPVLKLVLFDYAVLLLLLKFSFFSCFCYQTHHKLNYAMRYAKFKDLYYKMGL